MVRIERANNREDWLRLRKLGGSDIGAVVGKSPNKSNVDLWLEKTGRKEPADLSGIEAVQYGTRAEEYLRELFKLDHPRLEVEYQPNNIWINDRYPFAHASLDGWIRDEEGRLGVLEIKTATIQSAKQRAEWDNRIPDHYYTQVLWYLGITEVDFAILKAQQKWERDDGPFIVTREYRIDRTEQVEEEIAYLMKKGAEFWDSVMKDKRPALVLPEI